MAGTKAGAIKSKATILARDPDFYKRIGQKGGQNGHRRIIDSRECVSLGDYKLFSDGEILGKDGRPMVPQLDSKGYLRIRLRYGDVDKYGAHTYKVHRLVAENFIANPKNLPQVNHKDGDKTNNDVSNLEWCTNAENAAHARANGLCDNTSEAMNELGGQIRTAIESGYVINEIAELNGVNAKTIRRRVGEFEPEPISTLKVGKKKCYYYYDKSRNKYRVEANDRIPVGKQFSTQEDAQAYVDKWYRLGGFASDPELARRAGAIGGRISRRGSKKAMKINVRNVDESSSHICVVKVGDED